MSNTLNNYAAQLIRQFNK